MVCGDGVPPPGFSEGMREQRELKVLCFHIFLQVFILLKGFGEAAMVASVGDISTNISKLVYTLSRYI